ncbi:ABC transporter ATP-binding protein [Streptomyces sp. NPDC059166]|uniref:ABC transporter ATP-binding protein n=1 Tax=Streptomyces sp. NPDC059166 TaxID=3346752 RepID=UPI0036753B25
MSSITSLGGFSGARRNFAHSIRLGWQAGPATFSIYLLVTISQGLFPAVITLLTKWLIDGIQLGSTPTVGESKISSPGMSPMQAVFLIGICGALLAVLPHVSEYARGRLQRGLILLVQHRLYSTVNRFQGLTRFESPEFLDRLRLAQQAASSAPEQVVASTFGIIQSFLTVFSFLGVLITISPLMAIITIAASMPALFIQLSIRRQQSEMMWQVSPRTRRQLFYQKLMLDLAVIKETRLFGTSSFFLARMSDEIKTINQAEERIDRRIATRQGPLSVFGAVVAAAGLVWMVGAATRGDFSIGDVSAFIAAVAGVQNALGGAVYGVSASYQALLQFGHYLDVLETEPDLPIVDNPKNLPSLQKGIHLENVWFRYTDDSPWVLCGVTLTIPYGYSLALVGLNGAGKSTLVKLLCRLYDPTEGHITWDGIDIRDVAVDDLRNRISAVFQDYTSYDLSVTENIAIGDLRFADDSKRIRAAAERAGIREHIESLPHGYETVLTRIFFQSEGTDPTEGSSLSGGQWQRIALARALVREGRDLLILDEPSAGLDAEAERDMHEKLQHYQAGATSILISHRLSSVRRAALIAVLQDGRITETGNHAQLIESGGEYARLFALQASGYEGSAECEIEEPSSAIVCQKVEG